METIIDMKSIDTIDKVSLDDFIQDCVDLYMKKLNADIVKVSDMKEKVYILNSVYNDLESYGYLQPWDCIDNLSNLEKIQEFIDNEEE